MVPLAYWKYRCDRPGCTSVISAEKNPSAYLFNLQLKGKVFVRLTKRRKRLYYCSSLCMTQHFHPGKYQPRDLDAFTHNKEKIMDTSHAFDTWHYHSADRRCRYCEVSEESSISDFCPKAEECRKKEASILEAREKAEYLNLLYQKDRFDYLHSKYGKREG